MKVAVGIPSFMEADSIPYVTRQVDEGLSGMFNPADCVIINADGASPDQTSRVFLETPTKCGKEALVVTEQPGGKGRNLLRVLEHCAEREVGALAVVDADLKSITPDWMAWLLTPVARGAADYVLPLYRRRRFDGTVTNHFAYPLLYGYFGRDWRQPIGGEFAMSGEFANHLLRQRVEDAVYGYGITTRARSQHQGDHLLDRE
ncbi:MAG: glycosyltransferase [Blastocatellia bacterium]